jgi:RNA polymerase sigma factor (sigma-70 family)
MMPSGVEEDPATGAPTVEVLVARAARGDEDAWAELVARYTPLVAAVINGFELSRADAADVNQTVWLRLVEHLDRLRQPAALPMWMAKTTRHECIRLQRTSRRSRPFDPLDAADEGHWSASALVEDPTVDDDLLRAERHQALRDGFAQLPPRCRQLLEMMLREPPLTYEEIGVRMRIPIGSVGPTRGRCLHKLRNCPALVAFAESLNESGSGRDGRHDAAAVGR